MTQKVLKVGSSAAVTIPKKSLKQLGLKIGDEVELEVNTKTKRVVIEPAQKVGKENEKIARLTLDFVRRYQSDLEALARK